MSAILARSSVYTLLILFASTGTAAPSSSSHEFDKSIGVLIGFVRLPDTSLSRSQRSGDEDHLDWVPVEHRENHPDEKYERADDSDFDSPYESLWLSFSPSGVTVRSLQDIVVPHKDAFWRVGTSVSRLRIAEYGCHSEEESIWAAPVGTIPQLESLNEVPCMSSSVTRVLDYVGPDYLGFTSFQEATCAHYDESHSFGLISLDKNASSGGDLGAILGHRAELAWGELAQKVAPRGEEPNATEREADPCDAYGYRGFPTDWTLRHSQGKWHAFAKFHGAGPGICSRWEVNEEVRAPLPASLVGRNSLPIAWTELLRRFPTILDAFSSPRGDYVVVVADRQLTLVAVRNAQPVAVLATVAIPHGRVMMAEWALGSHVASWDQKLAALPGPSSTASTVTDIPD